MKKHILLLFLFLNFSVYSQSIAFFEKKLNALISKRNSISESDDEKAYENLAKYNAELEKLVLQFTSSNPETLTYSFKEMPNGLNIVTSADGQFRIYTWNTLEGGTMQFYKNVYQYKANGKVYSRLSKAETDEGDSGVNFYNLNEVKSNGKTYYITNSIAVGSSAAYHYEAKVFCIENGQLNDNAKLIKTKSGLKNTLGYDIDLSSSSNRDRTDGIEGRDYMTMVYDKKTKTIIIPLLNEDGKITKKKIRYQFTGKYFEKI
ncbi:hypothetical protein [Flavobacterium humi]|uniref:Uncharacterized protein n=1 Tax=Flavobacterium humi TaxID=2562683 RepID=A0A4Z0L585_9FLAO|nr:hypothetical protein [Flavobacterium humi]TGD56732.1 hypothetical protein E4635_14920 [Flavobacterium humi]